METDEEQAGGGALLQNRFKGSCGVVEEEWGKTLAVLVCHLLDTCGWLKLNNIINL